ILYNVVGNAIKFTDRGRVLVSVSYKNGTLEFKVKDTGIGLTEDEAGKLFQAFQQADVSTTRKYGGTGLGLALTRKLCEALGGQFNLLSSHAGIGSTFSASIGIVLPEDAVLILNRDLDFVDKSQTTLPSKQRSLQGIKVLVVDDSPDNQLLFSRILSKSGATTSSASDGLEGVEKALSGNFDAVLMDIQMPGMDGHEATFLLRSKGFLKPIIALTAHAMIEERQRALDSGFTDFLSKPLRQEDLLDLLSRVIQVP
ncbi:MAG: response regulator, partial [Proteobacteria bacterium]